VALLKCQAIFTSLEWSHLLVLRFAPLHFLTLPHPTLIPPPNLSTTALIILDFDIFLLPSSTKPANMSDVIVDEAVYQKIVQADNVSATQAST
jgi:hypothetical protein